jgi:hypothetical protein
MITLTGVWSKASPQDASRNDDSEAYRQLIGYIGLLLPLFIILLALLRDGEKSWKNLTSISAYYYTGANAAFVGMLVALALFLFTYPGYRNDEQNWADRWAATIAACAALLVAFFPTEVPLGFTALPWWHKWVGKVHFGAAIALFSMFAFFALWLFRKKAKGETVMPDGKKRRNWIYLVCGFIILGSMAYAGWNGFHSKPIFVPEAVALIAFSVSWLVKGYADRTIASKARSLMSRPAPSAG